MTYAPKFKTNRKIKVPLKKEFSKSLNVSVAKFSCNKVTLNLILSFKLYIKKKKKKKTYSQIFPSFDRTIKFELQELSLAKRSFGILVHSNGY